MPVPEFPAAPPGNPEELRTAAAGFHRLQAGFDPLADYVRGIAGRLYEQAWRGEASVAFLEHCDHVQWIMRQSGDRAIEYARVCDQWATELQALQQRHANDLVMFEQARERYHASFLTDPLHAEQWRESAEDQMQAAVADATAAVADAEIAEQQAAAAFAAITPPAFGTLAEQLFGADGRWLAVAAGMDRSSIAAGIGTDLLEHRKRLRWVRMLGSPARLAQLQQALPGGALLGPVAAGLEQYTEDAANPLLTPAQRRARVVEDMVVRTTYSAMKAAALARAGAGLGAVAGPKGAILGGVAGGAYGAVKGDADAEQKLDEQRGEVIPPGESALPGPNEVVDPPPAPPTADPPAARPRQPSLTPEFQEASGIRREAPPKPPLPPSPEWREMQAALGEGVPQAEPPPPSALPRPG